MGVTVVDLRQEGVLSIELAKLASEIEPSVRDEYTDYVGTLARANDISGLGWLINITCRNPYQTRIFDHFCKLKLLERCMQDGQLIGLVRVDSCGMKEAVESLCLQYGKLVTVDFVKNEPVWISLLIFLRKVAILMYIMVVSFFTPRLLCKKSRVPAGPIIYLDTFSKLSDFSSEGDFIDHYYPGMLDEMRGEWMDKIWYAPVIFSSKTLFGLKRFIDQTQQSTSNFLIMEEWLKVSDYLRALLLSFVLPYRIKIFPQFSGINVLSMFKEELSSNVLSAGLFDALLRYRFIYRLRQADVEVDKVIDWNENQVIDRSLCLATRDFYPGVRIIGYQGYIVSEHYLSHDPTCYERDAGTVPDVICVVNQALIERKKRYCSKQQVAMAPAFRFSQLISYQFIGEGKRDVVLLALPVHISFSRLIVQLAMQVDDGDRYQFLIKLHPSVSREVFLVDVPESADSRFRFVDDSLYDLFPRAALLVSSDSSACFEAVSCGVRVAVIGNRAGPTSNPLAGIVSSDCWNVCYDASCLLDMLEHRKRSFEKSYKESLMPVTQENVSEFMAL